MKITIDVDASEFLSVLERIAQALEGGQVLPATLEVDSKKVAEAVTDTPAKSKPAKKPAKVEAEPEVQEEPEEEVAEESKDEPEYDLTTVRAVLQKLQKAGQQRKAKALIAETGAERLSEVPKDQYGSLIEKAQAELEKLGAN